MYQFFISEDQILDNEIQISGEDVNHIKNVLRMPVGEKVILADGHGLEYIAEIAVFAEQTIICNLLEKRQSRAELPANIILFQGLPKGDKMDTIVQKAVELGAAKVIPVRMKRCVVKLDEAKAAKKCKRWQEIARAAAKQSGRSYIPEIGPVVTYHEACKMAEALDCFLIPYEQQDNMAESMNQIIQGAKKNSIGILIGPEGGFAPEEVQEAEQAGGKSITLGHRILRTETAGMTVLSVLMFMIEAGQTDGKEE